MENQRIFFSKKENVYYYVTYGEFPNCNACHKEVNRTLVYHTSWRKSGDEVRMYHIGCYQKISLRGVIDEFKTCVVTDKMPEEAHPVFERSPSLANSSGASTFEVSKILKGSEAEVKDRTKLAKDPNHCIEMHYEKNLKMFKKKEEELGYSNFLLQDLRRDELLQIEHENKRTENQINCKVTNIKEDGIDVEIENSNVFIRKEELPVAPNKYSRNQEIIVRIKNGNRDIIASLSLSLKGVELTPRTRLYSEELETMPLPSPEKEIDIGKYLESVKSSLILLPHQDPLELSYSKSNQKNIEDKSN